MSESHQSTPAIARAATRRATDADSGEAASSDAADPDQPPSAGSRSTLEVSRSRDAHLDEKASELIDARAEEALSQTLRAAGAEAEAEHDVRLRIVGDDEMAQLHEQYKNIPGTTDVLTFDAREPGERDASTPLDVDIVICADEAARRARERRHSTGEELLLYFVHALLHCLGHDDRDEDSSRAMHQREDEILAAMGIGPVFAPAARRGARTGALGAAEPTC